MEARACRRFSLLDGMILIAATAFAMAWSSARSSPHYQWFPLIVKVTGSDKLVPMNPNSPAWHAPFQIGWEWIELSIPFLTMETLGWLLIRLRRPRPSNRHLFRQPGFVASVTVVVLMAANAVFASAQLSIMEMGQSYLTESGNVAFFASLVVRQESFGQAVLASWAILALSGRWRREPGWIDRSGTVFGSLWITMLLVGWICERLI